MRFQLEGTPHLSTTAPLQVHAHGVRKARVSTNIIKEADERAKLMASIPPELKALGHKYLKKISSGDGSDNLQKTISKRRALKRQLG